MGKCVYAYPPPSRKGGGLCWTPGEQTSRLPAKTPWWPTSRVWEGSRVCKSIQPQPLPAVRTLAPRPSPFDREKGPNTGGVNTTHPLMVRGDGRDHSRLSPPCLRGYLMPSHRDTCSLYGGGDPLLETSKSSSSGPSSSFCGIGGRVCLPISFRGLLL